MILLINFQLLSRSMESLKFKIETLNRLLSGHLIGSTTELITEPEQIESAKKSSITFIGSQKYLSYWQQSKASAAILEASLSGYITPGENRAFIVVKNADLAMARLLELFAPGPLKFEPKIHPSAVIHETAVIGKEVIIGANCYIGADVDISDHVIIYPNVSIFNHVTIGPHTTIKSGTVILENCVVGAHCIVHTNVNIGTDGFGYRPSTDSKNLVKIPHIGNVVIGNTVEIGSGTCIDRGKFSSTIIGDATKIDNLVQIGHNCKIGRGCLIAGCVGISGSVTMGDEVIVGGQAGIKDHIVIGSKAKIGGNSGVMRDILPGQSVLGIPAQEAHKTLKLWALLRKMIHN